MGGRLPTLRRREAEAFIDHFAAEVRQVGHKFVGTGKAGSFCIELEHDYSLAPILLRKALRYLGVTDAEFWDWYRG